MKLRSVIALSLIALLGWSAPALADELFGYYGTTVGGPQFNRPVTVPPFGPSGVVVSFQAQPFQVNQSTTCIVESVQNGSQFDGVIYVAQGSFNPVTPGATVIRANDDGLTGVGSSLIFPPFPTLANTPYFVVTAARVAGQSGDFQNTVSCNSEGLPNPLVITHGGCTNVQGDTRTCLNNSRFLVSATGPSFGSAKVVQYGSGDSALFSFFDPQNWELLIKVLNNCAEPGINSYRVFAAGTTTLEVIVTVTDTVGGGSPVIITNPANTPFQNRLEPIANSCP